MLRKLEDLILYKDIRFYASFPAIITLPNSEILLLFRRARDTRRLVRDQMPDVYERTNYFVDHTDVRSQLTQLRFDSNLQPLGDAWTLPIDPEACDQDASLLLLNNGNILLFSFAWYPFPAIHGKIFKNYVGDPDRTGCLFLFWGGFMRRSEDNGKSWSPHQYLPSYPGATDILPGSDRAPGNPIRGQAIEIDGKILLPVYGGGPFSGKKTSSYLYMSDDNGQNWAYQGPIAYDEDGKIQLNETSLYVCPSGKIVAFMRTSEGDDLLAVAESTDNGSSWSKWEEKNIKGLPYHPLRLPDNRVFLCYGYRYPPYGIRARILDEECTNFDQTEEFVIRNDALYGDIGYPWSTLLPNGKILVVYYFLTSDGIRHIAGSVLEIDA